MFTNPLKNIIPMYQQNIFYKTGASDMNNTFYRALAFVFNIEGGYSNDPADYGGATNFGITQKTYDKYTQQHKPVSDITRAEAEEIYYNNYWIAGKCNIMPAKLAVCHFDWCVNHGVYGAVETLQIALGVNSDGIIGKQTITALETANEETVIKNYLLSRENWYKKFVKYDPTQSRFINGWLNRIDKLALYLSIDYQTDRSDI